MQVNEEDVRALRLAEQALMGEALEMKAARIQELEAEITYLRRTLNEAMAVPRPAMARQAVTLAAPRIGGNVPRRWKA
jgi:serine/threonine-protein kinase RIO1